MIILTFHSFLSLLGNQYFYTIFLIIICLSLSLYYLNYLTLFLLCPVPFFLLSSCREFRGFLILPSMSRSFLSSFIMFLILPSMSHSFLSSFFFHHAVSFSFMSRSFLSPFIMHAVILRFLFHSFLSLLGEYFYTFFYYYLFVIVSILS